MSPPQFLLCAVLLLAAPALGAPIRLALIEDESQLTMVRLAGPIERVAREAGAELLASEVVPCEISGLGARCRLPPRAGRPTLAGAAAAALEEASGIAFLFPPDPEFQAAVAKAAADPSTYRSPFAFALDEAEAEVSLEPTAPGGETPVLLRAKLSRPVSLRRRVTIGAYYHLRWKGRELSLLAIGRVLGGIGRVAAAAERWAESGPWTGVARGGTFGSAGSDARGRPLLDALERAGLRYSAVGPSELENWDALLEYRRVSTQGVRFLSANLALSSAPSSAALAPYAVFAASGTRVALVGLTSAKTTASLSALKRAGLEVRDPAAALKEIVPQARTQADIVVVLADLSAEEGERVRRVLGTDVFLGVDAAYYQLSDGASAVHIARERPAYSSPFPALQVHSPTLDQIEIERRGNAERADWRLTHTAKLLDDSVPEAEGFPEFPFIERFVTGFSSAPALLPSPRAVLGPENSSYHSRQFWTLAAAMLAERAGAEAALLPVQSLDIMGVGEVPEEYVRNWLSRRDDILTMTIGGRELKSLANESAEQASREKASLPLGPRPRFTLSGLDALGRVRGSPLEPGGSYRLALSGSIADALGLAGPHDPVPNYSSLAEVVLVELRKRASTSRPEDYRAWMEGRPVSEPGLWRLNFRDVGLNLRSTRVVRSDAFDPVPNSRIQGFDELLIGGVFKADAEYLKRELKWTNTLEAEYARSRITPRNAPQTTNTAANRIMLLTLGTRRAGAIRREWLARSWGPSVGVQYDGEFEAAPGRKRKQVYSLFPGVEFFDGTFIRSLELSGIVKRDLSREPPNTQTGLRLRSLFSREIGPARALLQGELWNNYFFLTKHDATGDLRMEGDFNVKLRVPIRKHLSVAPFLDYYWFALKARPLWGYSVTMGVSIGFSRLWKPQYEDF